MKHLKTYKKLFEGSELNTDQWEDVKDIIQSEILDKHHISIDDTDEKLGNYSGKYKVYDPIFSIKLDNLELSPYIIDDIYIELDKCQILCLSCHHIVTDIENNLVFTRIKQNLTRKLNNFEITEEEYNQKKIEIGLIYVNKMYEIYNQLKLCINLV